VGYLERVFDAERVLLCERLRSLTAGDVQNAAFGAVVEVVEEDLAESDGDFLSVCWEFVDGYQFVLGLC
jgi:hypothetical protein